MNPDPATSQSKEPWIPEGYAQVIGPDNQHYILPEFMVPALHEIFGGHRLKEDLGVFKAAGSVHEFNSAYFEVIGEGQVMVPAIPGSSDRERLQAHAEILALQQRLGISYKDAAHRLYMAQLARLDSDHKKYKAFANLQASTERVLQEAHASVSRIEKIVAG